MNGLDAAKTIRSSAHAEAGTIPIVAMTANAYKEDVQAALDAGMNAHIAKPINIDVFLSVVEKYTRYNNGWKR
jgi:CheY-like chemotaxis protein